MKNTLMFIGRRAFLLTGGPNISYPALKWRPFCDVAAPNDTKPSVEGLPWSVDEKTLKDALTTFDEVTQVNIIYDENSGRSKGFGFVHFTKEGDAVRAKDIMGGKALLRHPVKISSALEKARSNGSASNKQQEEKLLKVFKYKLQELVFLLSMTPKLSPDSVVAQEEPLPVSSTKNSTELCTDANASDKGVPVN